CVAEGGAGFGIVIDHLPVEGRAPCGLVRPFGITDETPVPVAMQARTITAIFFTDEVRAPAPCRAELVFLAGVDAPPVNRDEHGFLSLVSRENDRKPEMFPAPPYNQRSDWPVFSQSARNPAM